MSGSSTSRLEERLHEFIRLNFPAARQKNVTPTTKLLDEGVIDSLGLLIIVEYLEDEFDITTEDDELERDNFGSIGTLARFIERKGAR